MNRHVSLRKVLKVGGIATGALLLVIQLVPYGRAHQNPPVVREPAWDTPATRALAVRACFDCHSHQTRWPWYSHVAPASWMVQHDVDEGRSVLDFSDWTRHYEEAGDAAEEVREGDMPPATYLLAHPEARLSPEEKAALERGLTATLSAPRAAE